MMIDNKGLGYDSTSYGLFTDMTNEDYHKDNGFLSSSRIKLILQSPEMYFKKYIKKEIKDESSDIFDTGTAIHSRILEPDVYAQTVVFFNGTRRGKAWDEFKAANVGKLILGDMQKMQLDRMYESFIKSDLGPKLISGGQSEVSLFTNLNGFDIKVRADYLNVNDGKIFDLKSTSGIISEEKFKYNLESKLYGYDLQAALYVDAYSQNSERIYINRTRVVMDAINGMLMYDGIDHPAVTRTKFEFYWIVMSKDFDDIKFFKASDTLIAQGREKYIRALELIKKYESEGWEFKNDVIEVFPSNMFSGEF